MTTAQIENELKQAIDGLMMQSDVASPFEVYINTEYPESRLDNETVLKLSGMPAQYPMEVMEPEEFFRDIRNRNSEDNPQTKSYEQLIQKLRSLLHDVKVYRIGERNITVFILGRTDDSEIAGLKTMVVED